MALITSGTSAVGRQLLATSGLDDTMTLYLPDFTTATVEKTGGIELLRLSGAVPTGRSQQVFLPIYVDSVRIVMPSDFNGSNYHVGAIWYTPGLRWELWD